MLETVLKLWCARRGDSQGDEAERIGKKDDVSRDLSPRLGGFTHTIGIVGSVSLDSHMR